MNDRLRDALAERLFELFADFGSENDNVHRSTCAGGGGDGGCYSE